jgi:regulator of sirC expression with transglutaminase-like and TPR domain
MAEDLMEVFERLIRDDETLDTAEAALWVARVGRSGVDAGAALGAVDALAERARRYLEGRIEPAERVAGLCEYLRDVEGYRGDEVDFLTPENSFLDRVLDVRSGLPITLGVIYIAVGRRIGLDIAGVNFPGRFLVRASLREGGILIIDPFAGVVLDEAALGERVREAEGADVELTQEHLAAAPTRAVVIRMLNNLKILHVQKGDAASALGYCDWLVQLMPENPIELRDRALLLEQIEAFEAAAKDYEKMIDLVRDPSAQRRLTRRAKALRERTPKTLH